MINDCWKKERKWEKYWNRGGTGCFNPALMENGWVSRISLVIVDEKYSSNQRLERRVINVVGSFTRGEGMRKDRSSGRQVDENLWRPRLVQDLDSVRDAWPGQFITTTTKVKSAERRTISDFIAAHRYIDTSFAVQFRDDTTDRKPPFLFLWKREREWNKKTRGLTR